MRVVLGFSGGVDSAVAALLLKDEGWDVRGLFLDVGVAGAREDAVGAAAQMGVPLAIRDARAELEARVCRPFLRAYLGGETPNPCILCNPAVKFRLLLAYADEIGARCVATGHYARAEGGAIYKGAPENDQSYQLCTLTRAQAARLKLPLGMWAKPRVRDLAEARGVPIARKPDSMDICFGPDHDYAGWIERRAAAPGPGDALFEGRAVGRHEGCHRYTVGQRWPELYRARRLYVSAISPARNELTLSLWEDLFANELDVRGMNWLIDEPTEPIRASVRVRHTKWETPDCTVTPRGALVHIATDEPLRAVAKGQAAALYQGDRLIGGGYIA